MISQTLRDARKYEEATERAIEKEQKPDFHLCTRVGWMNDPNGFSYYKGEYHLFYQYHPYDSHWGPMHWGHAVSTDLLHWRYLPAALPRIRSMTGTDAFPAARQYCRTDGICFYIRVFRERRSRTAV